jgi:ABC-type lipoprotein release transport system permease subunit
MTGPKLLKMAWRNLWRSKRRTLLTLSGIAFGILLSVLFTAMQDRSFADMIDTSAKLGGGHVVVQHVEYIDTPTLTRSVQGAEAIVAAAEQHQDVHKAVQRITGQAMVQTATNNAGVFFVAFDPTDETEDTLAFLEGVQDGQLFEAPDSRGILIGERLGELMNVGMGDKIVYTLMDRHGEIVAGMERVSGIVSTGAPSVDAGLVLLPIDRVRGVIDYAPDEATQVAVFISDSRRSERVAAALQPSIGAADALTWEQVQPELKGFIGMKVGGARFMELVIMILVAAGIFNTLFVSVMERMREFGIMRAIGYSPGQITALVMWESLLLALVGLAVGGLVTIGPYSYLAANGIDLSEVYAQAGTVEVAGVGFDMTLHIGIFPENVAIIAAFVVCATLAAGLYPAWKAGRVSPVETIKLV